MDENPTFKTLGDYRWTPDLLASNWFMAETGKPPPSHLESAIGNSGGGFDRLRFVFPKKPKDLRREVDWATQMSYSGIYVHSAPWSVGAQGSTNTSHGCLNVSPDNAQWFYNNTKRGDVVEVRNTVGSVLSGTEGLGDWNIPWEQWKAGNARA